MFISAGVRKSLVSVWWSLEKQIRAFDSWKQVRYLPLETNHTDIKKASCYIPEDEHGSCVCSYKCVGSSPSLCCALWGALKWAERLFWVVRALVGCVLVSGVVLVFSSSTSAVVRKLCQHLSAATLNLGGRSVMILLPVPNIQWCTRVIRSQLYNISQNTLLAYSVMKMHIGSNWSLVWAKENHVRDLCSVTSSEHLLFCYFQMTTLVEKK